jgi:hypothetical protein
MMRGAHLFGLLNVFQAGSEPVLVATAVAMVAHNFLSVTWCREAFHGLRVQGVEVLILVGALFLLILAPVFHQGFGVTELTLSASSP